MPAHVARRGDQPRDLNHCTGGLRTAARKKARIRGMTTTFTTATA
jgi:hypothetical protein